MWREIRSLKICVDSGDSTSRHHSDSTFLALFSPRSSSSLLVVLSWERFAVLRDERRSKPLLSLLTHR
jgi:hypothetical protein